MNVFEKTCRHFLKAIYMQKLYGKDKGVFGRIKLKIINLIFDRLKEGRRDLLVEVKVGRYFIDVPITHDLPFLLKEIPQYSDNLPRIAKYCLKKYANFKLIDIGANVGDSVALLRSESNFPILCVEGDDFFFSVLTKNASKFENLYIEKSYVGDNNIELFVTSVESNGTAHLTNTGVFSRSINIERLTDIVKRNSLFQNAKMIKIDTDGFDNKIIRGSRDFLINNKSILFFEYDPFFLERQSENGLDIFEVLRESGYTKLLIYENNGDFLISADIFNLNLLEEIHHFYVGRQSLRYCDICAFHQEDEDLFFEIRSLEIQYFDALREKIL